MENIKIDQKVFILRDSGLFTQVKNQKDRKKVFLGSFDRKWDSIGKKSTEN